MTRALHLSVYPNPGKNEDLRYTSKRFQKYTQIFCGKLFFSEKHLSTAGLGQLANQAQHKARGIISAQRAAAKETGMKTNVPEIRFQSCPAKIESSKKSSFDYWISFETQFSKKRIRIPAKSHKRLNHFLRTGWELNPACEITLQKNDRFQVRVFIQREVEKAKSSSQTLGCDVGYTNAVARSDGYVGKNTGKIIKQNRAKNAERRRQNHFVKNTKTYLKQLLDVEAKRAVARCKRGSLSLVLESPKQIANLRSGRLQGWARCYFAKRCRMLGDEQEVWVWDVNPAYTSITCNHCGKIDKRSRVKKAFKCLSCKSELDADVNAALNIARKGSASMKKFIKSGVVNLYCE